MVHCSAGGSHASVQMGDSKGIFEDQDAKSRLLLSEEKDIMRTETTALSDEN